VVIELFRSLATEKEQRRLELRSKAANSAGCALAARGASALWWTESGRQHLRTLQRQRVARWAAGAAGPGPRTNPGRVRGPRGAATASALDPHTCWAPTPELENRLEKPSYENTARMQCTVTPEAAAGCGASPAGMDCAHPQLGPHQKREASTRTRKEMRPRK
jgi:hypothetical protein